MSSIKFKIVTPEKVVYESLADKATLPTKQGEITILPDHLPLVTVLQAGELVLTTDGKSVNMAISGGFAEIGKNEITILADTAERAEEIDEARAEEARQRAEKLMSEMKNKDVVEYTALAAKLEKELARLKVVRRKKAPNINNIN